MHVNKWLVGGFGAAVAVGAIVFGVITLTSSASAQGPQDKAAHFEELLAAKLGISVDTLRTAETTVRNQIIDEGVASGTISADQAAKLKSMTGSPLRGIAGPLAGHMGGIVHRAGMSVLDSAAKVTGISVQDVMTGLKNGQSLAQIAVAHGKTADQLKQGILTDEKTNLANAVSGGKLTQNQSDKLLKGLTDHLDEIVNHVGVPGLHHMRR